MVKAVREELKNDVSQTPLEFYGYNFTGSLRPAAKTPKSTVPPQIRRPDYASHPDGKSLSEEADKRSNTSIRVHTPEQIEAMREVCRIGRKILDIGGNAVKVGVTTAEIDRIVHEATLAENAYPSPLNYYNFPKSVCTSVNEVICHGIPDMRELQDGDIVNVDVSVYYNGYHADLNDTFFVGKKAVEDEDSKRLLECAYNCLSAAVSLCKPGTLYRDAGNAISQVAKQYQCAVNTTYCGHGVGDLFHTVPTIPHYAKNKAKGVMAPGHIFTIEPMINLGTYHDVLWPDGWTAVTADGKRSAQYEHTLLVTPTGVEVLTRRDNDPVDKMPEFDVTRYTRL